MQLRIMSFNTQHCMNYVTRRIDFEIMAETIREAGADVIGLQEIRGEGQHRGEYEAQAKILGELLGFNYYFAEAIRFGGVDPYGNALLSRFPIARAETVMIPDPKTRLIPGGYYETRCALSANLDIGVPGGLDVLVSHFGLNPDEHRQAVKTVTGLIPAERGVLMGDFNMKPGNFKLRPFRKKLVDTAAYLERGDKGYTFPSDRPNRKIDYIFVTRDINVNACRVFPKIASDHRALAADIEVRPGN